MILRIINLALLIYLSATQVFDLLESELPADFHRKFGLEYNGKPRALPKDLADFRIGFIREEFNEYQRAQTVAYDETTVHRNYRSSDLYNEYLELALDGLVDLVYVALGTAYLHGFDFNEAWRRVHEANMKKIRAERAEDSIRGSVFDVIKPEGWEPPSHDDLVSDNDLMEPHDDRA